MDDLRAISSNVPADVSARTTNSRLSRLIVLARNIPYTLLSGVLAISWNKGKRKKGALRILERSREGETSHYEGKCIATNYKGRTQLPRQRNFQRVPTKYVRSRNLAPLSFPVERSRMRCYTRSRPSF